MFSLRESPSNNAEVVIAAGRNAWSDGFFFANNSRPPGALNDIKRALDICRATTVPKLLDIFF